MKYVMTDPCMMGRCERGPSCPCCALDMLEIEDPLEFQMPAHEGCMCVIAGDAEDALLYGVAEFDPEAVKLWQQEQERLNSMVNSALSIPGRFLTGTRGKQ